jgi:hypothetical protein
MMLLSSLLVLGAATPTLALPGLNAVNISPSEAALHSEVLAQELLRRGLKVTAARDIQALLGAARQQQLMGCNEQSCIAELADALGAQVLVLGDVGKVDAQWSVALRFISSSDGKTLAAFSGQTKENVAALLDHAAGALAQQLSDKLGLALKPVPEAKDRVSRWWALAPAAVAVGGGVVGAVFTLQANASLATLKSAQFQEDALVAKNAGVQQQTVAWVGFGVAAAGAVGTAVLLLVGGDAQVAPVAMFGPAGGSVGVVGVLP